MKQIDLPRYLPGSRARRGNDAHSSRVQVPRDNFVVTSLGITTGPLKGNISDIVGRDTVRDWRIIKQNILQRQISCQHTHYMPEEKDIISPRKNMTLVSFCRAHPVRPHLTVHLTSMRQQTEMTSHLVPTST